MIYLRVGTKYKKVKTLSSEKDGLYVTLQDGGTRLKVKNSDIIISEDSEFVYDQKYFIFYGNRIIPAKYCFYNNHSFVFKTNDIFVRIYDKSNIFSDLTEVYPSYLKKYEDSRSYCLSDIGHNAIKLNKRVFMFHNGRIQKFIPFVKYDNAIGLQNSNNQVVVVSNLDYYKIQNNPKNFLCPSLK